jgi:hypothetical protein
LTIAAALLGDLVHDLAQGAAEGLQQVFFVVLPQTGVRMIHSPLHRALEAPWRAIMRSMDRLCSQNLSHGQPRAADKKDMDV